MRSHCAVTVELASLNKQAAARALFAAPITLWSNKKGDYVSDLSYSGKESALSFLRSLLRAVVVVLLLVNYDANLTSFRKQAATKAVLVHL